MRKYQVLVVLLLMMVSSCLTGNFFSQRAEAVSYQQLRQENAGRTAKKMNFIPTTKQAVAFTFGGLSRQSSLQDILQRLDENGMDNDVIMIVNH